ncbi:phospholipase, partial [Pseudomonas frederiksbergensis]|nr:phospholipase [Pseudomonas frederiksbergensis]
NGSKVVFHNGILATAMRASMSIPGVFAPVYLNGMVLVDGGLTDNYPVDIARQMGAEIIIGVDVQNPLMKADELTSMSNVLGQILNLV